MVGSGGSVGDFSDVNCCVGVNVILTGDSCVLSIYLFSFSFFCFQNFRDASATLQAV